MADPGLPSRPEPFALPGTILLGTATAGLQVEGGDRTNSWFAWAESGHIADGSSPIVANDHWNRLEQDTGLLRDLHVHTHRLSVEWSRVEPAPGVVDRGALSHYRRELGLLRDAGIVPLVTLHHFANPLWVEAAGGWLHRETAERFAVHVARVVAALGDLVSDWVTINEPNVYLFEGHVLGVWPPGHRRIAEFFRGTRMMVRAHEKAYRVIHDIQGKAGREARVGVAHHVRAFEPSGRAGSRMAAAVYNHVFHRRFIDPMSHHADFLGINYYTRDIVGVGRIPDGSGHGQQPSQGARSDLGWEIYPEGLFNVVRSLYSRHPLPIFVTENGVCDRSDRVRPRFIHEHLREVRRLIDAGVPVERYYHWTLMDNFEWILGESAPFGLYACDFRTQERSLRSAGAFYRDVCASRAVTPEMILQYL